MMDNYTSKVEDMVLSKGLSKKQLAELAHSLTIRVRQHHPGPRPVICGTMSMNGETSEWSLGNDNGGWQQWIVTRDQGFARVEYLDAMVDGLSQTDMFQPEEEEENE